MDKESKNFIRTAVRQPTPISHNFHDLIISNNSYTSANKVARITKTDRHIAYMLNDLTNPEYLKKHHTIFGSALRDNQFNEVYIKFGSVSEETCKKLVFSYLAKFLTEVLEYMLNHNKGIGYYSGDCEFLILSLANALNACAKELGKPDVLVNGLNIHELTTQIKQKGALYICNFALKEAKFHSFEDIIHALDRCEKAGIKPDNAQEALLKKFEDMAELKNKALLFLQS